MGHEGSLCSFGGSLCFAPFRFAAAFLERGERPAVRGVGRAERRANGKRTGGTKKARERKADDSSSSTSSSGSEREEGEVRSRPARGEAVVCMGKACSKNGAEKLADTMRSEHGMSVKECGCMGKCKEGPNVVVGEGMAVDTNLLNAPLHPSHSP